MTPILGALVLVAVVSLVFFTKDGRRLYEDFCDELDSRLLFYSNVRQRRRERSRHDMPTMTQKKTAWTK